MQEQNEQLLKIISVYGGDYMKEIVNIPFSPPDITEAEIEQVTDALRSGW